ncbi:MAG: hypothetical protein R3F20_10610 [Planctomycetota bacterium]
MRRAAALALTWRGDLDPRVLARLLGDDDARVAETALLAIATGAAGEGLEPARLVRWLRHEEPALRSAAALAAARAEAPDPLLARLETESDPAVRAALYFALRPAAGDEAVAARLAAGLEESAREPREAALLALALGGAAGLDLEAIARGRGARGLEMLALDLLAGRDPERAAAAAQALLGPEARASEELAARAGELLAGVAPAETRRRKAALRCQLRIDDLGLSPSWRLSGLAHALLLEIEGLDRPLDGRESIRVGAGGEARAIPRMNAEEEDLRLWFDRHPLLDRRRQREVPGLGVR